jgi:hypothetical protein
VGFESCHIHLLGRIDGRSCNGAAHRHRP